MYKPPFNLVAGIGSPHGDDAVGFLVTEHIRSAGIRGLRCLLARHPIQLVTALNGCQRLWVIDACCSNQAMGTITRLEWPVEHSAWPTRSSTHAMGLLDALHLAENLGTLPAITLLYGVEVGEAPSLRNELSSGLSQSATQVAKLVLEDIKKMIGDVTLSH